MNILISVSTRILYNPTQWRRRKRKEVGNILVFNKHIVWYMVVRFG